MMKWTTPSNFILFIFIKNIKKKILSGISYIFHSEPELKTNMLSFHNPFLVYIISFQQWCYFLCKFYHVRMYVDICLLAVVNFSTRLDLVSTQWKLVPVTYEINTITIQSIRLNVFWYLCILLRNYYMTYNNLFSSCFAQMKGQFWFPSNES